MNLMIFITCGFHRLSRGFIPSRVLSPRLAMAPNTRLGRSAFLWSKWPRSQEKAKGLRGGGLRDLKGV